MPISLIFILFSGFYANNKVIPDALNWIQWISPIRWLFSGVITVQFKGLKFECNLGEDQCVPTGNAYLVRLGLSGDSFWRSAVVLLAMIVFFHLLAYTMLRVRRVKWITPSMNTAKTD